MTDLNREAEEQFLEIIRNKLYTAVISDVLDSFGYLDQAMAARIRPVERGMRIVGRAHTALTADVYERRERPYDPEIAAIDSLKPGDVMVASTGDSKRTCFWGELLSTAAIARGATGCVIDGYSRDIDRILEMGFPLFTTGYRPVDSAPRSTVVGYGCPVECGDVLVNEGDIVVADSDGIVVIPREALAQVVSAAAIKVDGENQARELLQQGALLREVFDQLGIL